MVNQQTLQGHWNEIKGQLRRRWSELSQDDLEAFHGNVDELVGLIQRKSGEARATIETVLDDLTKNGASAFARTAEEVRDYVEDAAERIQEGSRQAVDSVRQGYEDVQDVVRDRPTESVAVCFGLGVITGLLLGLVVRKA